MTDRLSMSVPSTPAGLHARPEMPLNGEQPVFSAPWQAQAFAMTLALHQKGLFTWTEWAQALADQIKAAQLAGDADVGDTYYQHWLAALEGLVATKGLCSTAELGRYREAWEHAANRTPHGQPIELRPQDLAS